MARKKSLLGKLFSFGGKSTGSSKGFADAMKILRSTKPTKLRNSKSKAGIFH
jgi:hypothetical protein